MSKFKTKWEYEMEDSLNHRRRLENIQKRKEEKRAQGFDCTFEGCQEHFDNNFELNEHIKKHQSEYRKDMICFKKECKDLKFQSRREYSNHIEEHKQDLKKKVTKNIRSVLLLNKHGILLDEFDREFFSVIGKKVPSKLMGFSSILELVSSLPEVVEVIELEDGQKILHGVPDEKTQEMAGAVRSQITNFAGFNWRTGQVLSRVRGGDVEKVVKSNLGTLEVSDYVKRKLREVIEILGDQNSWSFEEFEAAFENEVGHPLELEPLGFIKMIDFIAIGVPDILELDMSPDGMWMIVPVGCQAAQSPQVSGDQSAENLRKELKAIIERHPFGISGSKLMGYKRYNTGQLLEMALASPDICLVDNFNSELTILPAGFSYGKSKPTFPLHRLADLKTEIQRLMAPVKEKVSLKSLERALEGSYGRLPNPTEFNCETFLDILLLMPDVCRVSRAKDGTFMVQNGRAVEGEGQISVQDIPDLPPELLLKLRRVLNDYPGGLKQVEQHYKRITGEDLVCPGYTDPKSLLRDLNGRQGFKWDGVRLTSSCNVRLLPVLRGEDIPTGWVEIINQDTTGTVQIVAKRLNPQVWDMEKEMEEFYLSASATERAKLRLRPNECVVGQTSASVLDTTAIHRARILETFPNLGLVKVLSVDHGTRLLVSQSALFRLQPQFCRVPEQVASVDLSYLLEDGGLKNMEDRNRNINNNILEVGELLYLEKKSTKPSGRVCGQQGSDQINSIFTKFIFGLMIQQNKLTRFHEKNQPSRLMDYLTHFSTEKDEADSSVGMREREIDAPAVTEPDQDFISNELRGVRERLQRVQIRSNHSLSGAPSGSSENSREPERIIRGSDRGNCRGKGRGRRGRGNPKN